MRRNSRIYHLPDSICHKGKNYFFSGPVWFDTFAKPNRDQRSKHFRSLFKPEKSKREPW